MLPVDLSENPADPKANIISASGRGATSGPAAKKKSSSSSKARTGTSFDGELILASTSPYRRELLERLGIPFRAEASGVDESLVKADGLMPERTVMQLALEKAGAVSKKRKGAIVIASDQAPEFDGELLDKPGTVERAVAQLQRLSGKTHRLLTALVVHDGRTGKTVQHMDVHTMAMRKLTRAQIEAYVERDQPLDCSGSYKWESLGVALFESVRGDDSTAIIGLPLIRLVAILQEMGVDVLGPGA
ncbi:MAG: nucleoside triphosphate pyrophosphatase [Planctomycetota bacterium]